MTEDAHRNETQNVMKLADSTMDKHRAPKCGRYGWPRGEGVRKGEEGQNGKERKISAAALELAILSF